MSVAVLPTFHVHPTEDLLEEYVFGRLQEPALSTLEDHLLICSSCQSALAELEGYIRAAKSALAERQPAGPAPAASPPAWARLPDSTTTLWAVALMLALASGAMLSWRTQPAPETARVTLAAFRGGDAVAFARAAAQRPLDLAIDGTTLPPAGAYRLQIVDASGENAWSGAVVASGGMLSAHLSKGLGPGVYWVRLYASQAPAEAGLLREFGLHLE
jgi:anti-sigma factor RsiW